MKIHVINGPNLNLLGKREPEHYGARDLEQLKTWLRKQRPEVDFTFFQSNGEGELIDAVQRAAGKAQGLVINPGGLSHTSVALLDAIRTVPVRVVEVHLSQVHAREDYRRRLLTAEAASGVISGLGAWGYLAAVDYLHEMHKGETQAMPSA